MEYELVLIRPDELFLKSEQVMRRMMKRLAHNIKVALKDNDVVYDHIIKQRLCILIRSPEISEVIDICKYLPGISILMPAAVVGLDIEAMNSVALELSKQTRLTKSKSFAIRAKRSDKSIKYKSKDIEELVGAYVKLKTKAKVNLRKPDVIIYVELLNNKALLSTKKVAGIGGLPVGVSGKVVCLMRNKDTDLVAAYLFLRRGCEIEPLHFRTDERVHQYYRNKLKHLNRFAYGSQIKATNIKGGFSISLASKLASHKDIKALCIGSTNLKRKHLNWMRQASLPVFTPLVGISKEKLAEFKTLIFK